MRTLLYRMENKVPLYSTGNNIEYPRINHNGKENKNVYMYITESLCCTEESNIIL